MSAHETIGVSTQDGSYDVHVGAGILDGLGELVRGTCAGRAARIISDSNVAPLYANDVALSLLDAGFESSIHIFEAGEASKSMETLSELLERLAEGGLDRDDVVVALGGGVTGDLAGLAAALYLRGIKLVQVPTSLLAMVDSSVGGKCAVDLAAGKNLAGAFWQPSLVVADVDCLDTIAPELFRDSCGEVIKHAVLADEALFAALERRPLTDAGLTGEELVDIVARNVRIKRDVVEADERELGLRQTLNLGHSIGHAIEAASGLSLGHGSSVAAGLCCIARASSRLGWCSDECCQRIVALVASHGLPTNTDVPHKELLSFMLRDKKRHGDGINLVIPREIADVELRRCQVGELEEIVRLGCGAS